MDFEKILSGYKAKACVLSVEPYPDGGYGNIRIVAGNEAHCEEMLHSMGRPFVPGSPYEEFLPQNNIFEDYIYRSAILGKPMHSYVPIPQMNLWVNMFLLPLESDREDVGYCLYAYDVTPEADSEQRASLSSDMSAAVLQTCIKLRGSTDLHKTIREIIEDVRKICDAENCCIVLSDREKNTCRLLCESLKPGTALYPLETYWSDAFVELVRTWDDTIGNATCVIVKDKHDMDWLYSVNPMWATLLRESDVNSLVLFPLKHNEETLGYLWAICFDVENAVKIKEALELTSFFVASEIANYQLLERLERMSSTDTLTQVFNRNKMNATVDEIVGGRLELKRPYTVVFADLNGLKQVNDTVGHNAGDQLIQRAASVLRETFADCDVFRAGGDEFMILAQGMDEAELSRRQEKVARLSAERGVSFSSGVCVVHGDEDILTAMHLADQDMYCNKEQYYQTHPDQKGR